MTLTILNILYVLVAIAMVGFILMQRGAGAQAGSGFGAGASATVFGARGAASFLTRSTAVLATLFFATSLGMGMFIAHTYGDRAASDLGVMGRAAPAAPAPAPAPASEVPALPGSDAAQAAEVPAGPAPSTPAEEPPKE
jgi:preprotein translocase subunit SecG